MISQHLLGRHAEFDATLDLLVSIEPTEEALGRLGFALFIGMYGSLLWGCLADRAALLARATAMLDRHGDREPSLAGFIHQGFATFHLFAREEPWRALARIDAARMAYLRGQHARGAAGVTLVRGFVLWTLGATTSAEHELLGVAGADDRYGGWSSYRPFVLVHIASERGDLDRARRLAEGLIASGCKRRIKIDEGRGRWLLGDVLSRAGEPDRAERELDAALALLTASSRIDCPGVLATRAALYLRQGRAAHALTAAEDGISRYQAAGGCGFLRGPYLRLTHAECLASAGQRDAARGVIGAAREQIFHMAAEIADPDYRKSFLQDVPENRRTLDLAREWLGDGDA